MSRKKTAEELDREAQEADEEASRVYHAQRECSHWNCHPTEYWFETGKVREMTCDDCGKTKWFEEDE